MKETFDFYWKKLCILFKKQNSAISLIISCFFSLILFDKEYGNSIALLIEYIIYSIIPGFVIFALGYLIKNWDQRKNLIKWSVFVAVMGLIFLIHIMGVGLIYLTYLKVISIESFDIVGLVHPTVLFYIVSVTVFFGLSFLFSIFYCEIVRMEYNKVLKGTTWIIPESFY